MISKRGVRIIGCTCSLEVGVGDWVVDGQLVRLRGEVLLQGRQGMEALVEGFALWELVQDRLLANPLSKHLVLVQHLPNVEVSDAGPRRRDKPVSAVELQHRLKLAEGRRLGELGRALVELLNRAIHLLECVNQLDHAIADVVDLAKELVIPELGLLIRAVHVKLVTKVKHDSIGLTYADIAIHNVWQIGKRVQLQNVWLATPEPFVTGGTLELLVLGLFVLQDHAEHCAKAADLPVTHLHFSSHCLVKRL
mmetsp:Transcript_29163/g.46807  ORF Transcript_29163/g.46807 Transcript_29163/m.46807 type:complete len:251 (+) Transcript_29163:153-905(+)